MELASSQGVDPTLIFLAAGVAIIGTLVWLVTAIASAVFVIRLDPEARAQVPGWLWLAYGLELLSAPVWPVATLASLAGVIAGAAFAARAEGAARRTGLAVAAVGGVYLGLVLAVAGLALIAVLTA